MKRMQDFSKTKTKPYSGREKFPFNPFRTSKLGKDKQIFDMHIFKPDTAKLY